MEKKEMSDNSINFNKEKSDALYYIYDKVTEQIKFCDTKTGLMLASSGIVLGSIFNLCNSIENLKLKQYHYIFLGLKHII